MLYYYMYVKKLIKDSHDVLVNEFESQLVFSYNGGGVASSSYT